MRIGLPLLLLAGAALSTVVEPLGFLPKKEEAGPQPAATPDCPRACHLAVAHRLRGQSFACDGCWTADIGHPTLLGLPTDDSEAQSAFIHIGESVTNLARTLWQRGIRGPGSSGGGSSSGKGDHSGSWPSRSPSSAHSMPLGALQP